MSGSANPIRVPLADWRTFQKEFSPLRFDAVVNASSMGAPRWLARAIRGGAVPSNYLLRRIGYKSASPRPTGWIEICLEKFKLSINSFQMIIVLRHKGSWVILLKERGKVTRILCFYFGPTVILTRAREEAMHLIVFLLSKGLQQLSYQWVPIC